MSIIKADITIIGAGIIGLTFAYYYHKQGKTVAIIEQNSRPISSSVRNFGFITITGQERQKDWQMAKDSAKIWQKMAKLANIEILQTGSLVSARSEAAEELLRAYLNTEMGEHCKWFDSRQVQNEFDYLSNNTVAALYSPFDLRVDPVETISKLIPFIMSSRVNFYFNTRAYCIKDKTVFTSTDKQFESKEKVIIATSNDLKYLFPDYWKNQNLCHCRLQMTNIMPNNRIKLDHILMSDLSMIFYRGFSELPQSDNLKEYLIKNYSTALEHLIHIIVVQNSDGSLTIGDSHQYVDDFEPYHNQLIDEEIYRQFKYIFKSIDYEVKYTWQGYYPYTKNRETIIDEISKDVFIISINRGKGMTMSWKLADEFVNKKH